MKYFGIILAGFLIHSAAMAFPSCEEARRSTEQSRNKTLVQIVSELGKLNVQIQVLLEKAQDLAAKIHSGAVDRDSGIQQLNAYKAQARQIEARNQELKTLSDCITK